MDQFQNPLIPKFLNLLDLGFQMLSLGLHWRFAPDATLYKFGLIHWPHVFINPTSNKALSVQEFRFVLNSAVEIICISFPVIFLHFVEDPQDRFHLAETVNLSHNHTAVGLQDHSGKKAEIIEQPTLHPRR